MLVEKYGCTIQKSLFAETNQDSTFFHTPENSKHNITSKYFSFFNNKPHVSWVAHITRDFLTCYPCLYYSSMHKPDVNIFWEEKNFLKRNKQRQSLIWNEHVSAILELCTFYIEYKKVKLTVINFRGRTNVNYFIQT